MSGHLTIAFGTVPELFPRPPIQPKNFQCWYVTHDTAVAIRARRCKKQSSAQDDKPGVIELGKLADIVAVRATHGSDLGLEKVDFVMKDGVICRNSLTK